MLIIKKNNINKLKNYGFREGNFYDWDAENHYIKDKKYKSLYFRFCASGAIFVRTENINDKEYSCLEIVHDNMFEAESIGLCLPDVLIDLIRDGFVEKR